MQRIVAFALLICILYFVDNIRPVSFICLNAISQSISYPLFSNISVIETLQATDFALQDGSRFCVIE